MEAVTDQQALLVVTALQGLPIAIIVVMGVLARRTAMAPTVHIQTVPTVAMAQLAQRTATALEALLVAPAIAMVVVRIRTVTVQMAHIQIARRILMGLKLIATAISVSILHKFALIHLLA